MVSIFAASLSVVIYGIVAAFPISFLVCILILWNRHLQYDHIPGPKRTSFFFGNISDLYGTKRHLWCDITLRHALVYGPIFVWWYYYIPVIIISSPELMKHGLVTLNLPKAPDSYDQLAYLFGRYRFLGSGLVTLVNHQRWKQERILINPAFHHAYLKNLVPKFNSIADTLVAKLMKVADGETVINMAEEFQKATLDVIAKVALSMDLKCLDDGNSEISDSLANCCEAYEQSYADYFLCLPFYKSSYKKNIHHSLSSLRKFAKNCIYDRIEAMKTGQQLPDDIMGIILQSCVSDVSIEHLVDEIVTFMFGGQDTTSNQLSFALFETLVNRDIEDRIVEEIDDVLGDKQIVDYSDTGKLEYVGQTLKESLRKHPPVAGTSRITAKPEKFGQFQIPKGTKIFFSFYVNHNLPAYWKDPDIFNPDRFLASEGGNKISNFVYLPFSCGSRICIGKVFSRISSTIFMSRLLQKFKFTLVPGQTLEKVEKVTVRPKDGVFCTIQKRAKEHFKSEIQH